MAEHQRVAPTVQSARTVERASAGVGTAASNDARRRALPEGGGGGRVPALDDVFWEGFSDQHVGLMGDIVEVTARAIDLQPQVPSPEDAATLDRHIDGIFALEQALAAAITDAHAGSVYGDDDALEIDTAAMQSAVDLWDRIDVALDLLREHNDLYTAVLGVDLAGQMKQLAVLARLVIDSGLERSMAEAGKGMQAKLAAFDESWKVAAKSVAKLPLDVGVDVAVGAGISMALAAMGVTATAPAVAMALLIAGAASLAWNAASSGMGPKPGPIHETLGKLNGSVDVAADAAAIEQVGRGIRTGAEGVGKVSLGMTVLLDVVSTGVAIDGMYEAASAWEAFKREDARMQTLWAQCVLFFGGFVRFTEQMQGAATTLGETIEHKRLAIERLESIYGDALHDV